MTTTPKRSLQRSMLSNGEKLWLELQWRPVAGRWIRPDQEPSAEELMSRSVPISGTAVRILSPEDNLLQVALHTAKHTYIRAPGFRLHLDVDRIVKHQKINWNIFIRNVLRLQVKTPVYFSLIIPSKILGTPIPENVLKELEPPKWKVRSISHWLTSAGLFNPDERKFSRTGYLIFNALLYDNWSGLLKGIFPERSWMVERYEIEVQEHILPFYIRRLVDLTFKRLKT